MSIKVRCLIAAMALGVAFCGCGKKQPAPDTQKPLPSASVNEPSTPASTPAPAGTPQAVAPPPAAPSAQPVTPAVIPATSNAEAALGDLTQALRKYAAEKQRVPASINEVVAAGYIQNLPQPPAGKRYVIDAKRVAVVLQ